MVLCTRSVSLLASLVAEANIKTILNRKGVIRSFIVFMVLCFNNCRKSKNTGLSITVKPGGCLSSWTDFISWGEI
jgi:hypothetical protein